MKITKVNCKLLDYLRVGQTFIIDGTERRTPITYWRYFLKTRKKGIKLRTRQGFLFMPKTEEVIRINAITRIA